MKAVKRILYIFLLVLLVMVIGYLVFTGSRLFSLYDSAEGITREVIMDG
jgi:hypothetical protein